jgi:hypothetical protein
MINLVAAKERRKINASGMAMDRRTQPKRKRMKGRMR